MSTAFTRRFAATNTGGVSNLYGSRLAWEVTYFDPDKGEDVTYIHTNARVSVREHLERNGIDFASAKVRSFHA